MRSGGDGDGRERAPLDARVSRLPSAVSLVISNSCPNLQELDGISVTPTPLPAATYELPELTFTNGVDAAVPVSCEDGGGAGGAESGSPGKEERRLSGGLSRSPLPRPCSVDSFDTFLQQQQQQQQQQSPKNLGGSAKSLISHSHRPPPPHPLRPRLPQIGPRYFAQNKEQPRGRGGCNVCCLKIVSPEVVAPSRC